MGILGSFGSLHFCKYKAKILKIEILKSELFHDTTAYSETL